MNKRSFSEERRRIYCEQHQAVVDALLLAMRGERTE